MKKKIVKLTEQDLEKLVKKIIKEDDNYDDDNYEAFYERSPQLADLHDEVLYLTPGFGMGGTAGGVEVFEQMMDAIDMDGTELSDEAKGIIKRLRYDLSALEGFNERVVKLYEVISGENLSN